MAINRGLGKGLGALLQSTGGSAQKEAENVAASLSKTDGKLQPLFGRSILHISVTEIVPNPRQPRKNFALDALAELAASIKVHGVIEPLIVRKKENKYELVAGERRWRASQQAGLDKVPVVVKGLSDEVSLEQSIIENVQREGLNALEEAESYALLMKEFSLTQEQVAEKVGKARSSVANTLRLNELPREVKESLCRNEITAGHARAILAAGNVIEQLRVWKKVIQNNLNVRDAENLTARKNKTKQVKKNETEKSDELTNIEQKLTAKFATKVELSGDEQNGLISIRYFSHDELDRIYTLLLTNEVI
ncbi:MAG: ParB/RepB/Spo0J family partition protein [Candidatus Margulisbacteria bacterium]|jgi:ParB family chromosome partitioning protein|nr:ParB/RepB/Spo0J family partition protein [Candidatus Margulisiibacteriota bacterium]